MNPDAITLTDVWKQKSKEQVDEIVAFWKQQNALPKEVDPYQRAQQVILMVRNESEELIGITTAELGQFAPLRNHLYFFRGMLIPSYQIPGLFIKMTVASMKVLSENVKLLSENPKPIGAIAELENQKMKMARLTKLASGFTLIGFSKRNTPIYVYYFQGSTY